MKKFIIRFFSYLIILLVVVVGALIIYGTVTDFKPEERVELAIVKEGVEPIEDTVLTFFSWNLGYGGLGADMDFFYDGGARVRPLEEYYAECYNGIMNYLGQQKDYDFIILQEVDKHSKRSYYSNQVDSIMELFDEYHSYFARNYDVKFVPVPMGRPMGRVVAGQMNISKYQPTVAERIGLPGDYSWPTNLFMLDRCFILNKYPLANGKELILINTHNSAFDEDGFLRKQELGMLKKYMIEEYNKGNYVVAGGDWNMNPLNYDNTAIVDDIGTDVEPQIEADAFPEDWTWAWDPTIATNRDVSRDYVRGETSTTIIDYFILSPNVSLEEVKNIDLQFEHADHQPVTLSVKLAL